MPGAARSASFWPRWAGDGLALFLLLAVALALSLPRYRCGVDLGDEGFLAYGAIRVLDGQLPNRDFVSLQPPLSFYTAALVFKVLGTSLVSLRVAGVLLYVLIVFLVYGLARRFVGWSLALASALPATLLGLPFFHFVPLAMWQGLAANLAAGLLYLWATQRANGLWPAFVAGLFTAASFLLRQDQAVYLSVAIVLYTIVLQLVRGAGAKVAPEVGPPGLARLSPGQRALLLWAAGLALILVPAGVYWFVCGAVGPMFRQLVVFPVTTYARTSSLPFPSFSSGLTLGPRITFLLYYVPPLLELVLVVRLALRWWRKRFGAAEARLTFLLAWASLFYCQVLARSDVHHLLITLAPFLVLCGCAFQLFLRWLGGMVDRAARVDADPGVQPRFSRSARTQSAAAALAWVALVGFLWLISPGLLSPVLPPSDAIALPQGGVRVEGGPNLKKFVLLVQSQVPPERSILALPYQPMFYFLCQRRNPTRWNYIWPGDQSAAEHEELVHEARQDSPGAVLLTREADLKNFAPSIVDYAHAEYRLAAKFGEYSIYLPGLGRNTK